MRKQITMHLFMFAAICIVPSMMIAQDEKSTEFLEAAKWGELEDLKGQLANGANVNAKTESGMHAGAYAFEHFEDDGGEMIRYLLNQGLNPKILDDEEANLMHLAVENEGSAILRELHGMGVDIEGQNEDGSTPLFLAAQNKDFEAVKILVELGANPNVMNNDQSILDYYDLEDDEQWDDLMTFPLSDQLLAQLAVEAVYTLESSEKVAQMLEKELNWNEVADEDGSKLLHLAAELDDSEILQLLLDKGIDPNQLDEDGKNAIWNAESEENALALIKAGTDVNQLVDGESLLSAHIYYGLSEFVELFIANGADVSVKVDGKSLVAYCKDLLKLEERDGPRFETPELQAADLKNWKEDIEKSMAVLKQNGVK